FAGNVLPLTGSAGPVLAMSTTAHTALRADQIARLSAHCQIVAVDVSTVEAAGGSVRCMLAGIHLPPRHDASQLARRSRLAVAHCASPPRPACSNRARSSPARGASAARRALAVGPYIGSVCTCTSPARKLPVR